MMASPVALSLAYERPAWVYQLDGWCPPVRKCHAVRWQGNVAYVRTNAIGFRLVETPEGWRLALWMPARQLAYRCQLFSDAGSYAEAVAALACLHQCEARPVYPPLAMGVRAA